MRGPLARILAWAGSILTALLAFVGLGCSRDPAAVPADASLDAEPPWDVAQPEPEPRPGMVWIPGGVLIAGTPPERLPRVADEEMAGEQVVMRGFYVDVFPYPNEVGAIPTTNITQAEARALCEAQDKRLCTELELERACKGPSNATYEYGDAYKAAVCGTGTAKNLVPNGFNAACSSPFGVHDLHGGVWSWTASQWRRDTMKTNLVAIRGGNGIHGELIGRCANGRGIRPDVKRPDVGVRCCVGEANSFEVVLSVTRGEPLKWQAPDARIAPLLEKLAPPEIQAAVRGRRVEAQFRVERMWIWHPLGNEELYVGGGCAHPPGDAMCGIVIARMRYEAPMLLTFVGSELWQPTVGETETAREIFLHGGDRNGAFRRRVSYEWGKITAGPKERKKRRKGKREATYD
ncbi:MAG TPA: SUMF1/EgtB/PvdO family nonheme iron enzyme [Polyangiaceae bacterium]|nr:SUMF1/EgtB/PvdO family nonheme iron enzyme [Polyangiaceae bacterium]